MAKPETRVECLHQNSSETCNTLHRSTRNLLIQIFLSTATAHNNPKLRNILSSSRSASRLIASTMPRPAVKYPHESR